MPARRTKELGAPQVRVRATTVYVIEARLDSKRPWKPITEGKEWPPYKDEKKAHREADKLCKNMPREQR